MGVGAHVNSTRALVIAIRSKSWHICRCQACFVGIAPRRALQRRFKTRALDSFLNFLGFFFFFFFLFSGELLPRQRMAWETSQRCSFENGNKWVMEAEFHELIRGGSQCISVN